MGGEDLGRARRRARVWGLYGAVLLSGCAAAPRLVVEQAGMPANSRSHSLRAELLARERSLLGCFDSLAQRAQLRDRLAVDLTVEVGTRGASVRNVAPANPATLVDALLRECLDAAMVGWSPAAESALVHLSLAVRPQPLSTVPAAEVTAVGLHGFRPTE